MVFFVLAFSFVTYQYNLNIKKLCEEIPFVPSNKVLNEVDSRWCYLTIIDKSFFNDNIIKFESNQQVSKDTYISFLSSTQISSIQSSKKAIVYSIPKDLKAKSDIYTLRYSSKLFVIADPSFSRTNFKIFQTLRPDTFIVDTTNSQTIDELLDSNLVLSVGIVPEIELQNNYGVGFVQTGSFETTTKGSVQFIPRPLHDKGITGEGQTITIIDSGLNVHSKYFVDENVEVPFDNISQLHRKIKSYYVSGDREDGSGHGTHCAGTAAGKAIGVEGGDPYDGAAPDAKISFYDIGINKSIKIPSALYTDIIKNMTDNNSYLSSNSYSISPISSSTNVFRNRFDENLYNNNGFLFVFAAGNHPFLNDVRPPGNGKNVLTVGAMKAIKNMNRSIATFSGRGPTTFGQVKPEVVVPGQYVLSASHTNNTSVRQLSGTSMATPLVAGTMVLLRQYLIQHFNNKKPSGPLLRALAIASADKEDPETPNPTWGFGSLNMANIVEGVGSISNSVLYDEISTFSDNESVYSVEVKKGSDLRIVISYNDIPLAPESEISLSHDIDLFVVGPDSKIYHPLFGDSEDCFSTNERIYIRNNNIVEGKYFIYLKSTKCISVTCESYLSLVVVGQVSNLTKVNNQIDWSKLCTANNTLDTKNGCICKEEFAGLFCQHNIITLTPNIAYNFTFSPYQTKFFRISIANKKSFTFNLTQVGAVTKEINASLIYSLEGGQTEITKYLNNSIAIINEQTRFFDGASYVYVNFTCLSQTTANAKIVATVEESSNNKWITIGLIIGSALLAIAGIILAVLFVRLKKKKENDVSTNNGFTEFKN
ncbi:subtilisin-like serine peptidase [Histomonas meleagridis]|uniref:subtilisin-like serine peptidase n=1 Tax=Histomonas meleagridis TaxID=135588 RepID=UPI00355A313A|nr:subtilisin-like serine peptidase [Histomonas meleagridis]KAH0803000.1 subtilisin-like serine peptidase [Histomonas meleagridis]